MILVGRKRSRRHEDGPSVSQGSRAEPAHARLQPGKTAIFPRNPRPPQGVISSGTSCSPLAVIAKKIFSETAPGFAREFRPSRGRRARSGGRDA
ncbi:MAG: hypothetical protein ACKOBP_05540 [Planctomycetia bacterium]